MDIDETTSASGAEMQYSEVFSPTMEGRVIVFDLETSGFSSEDRYRQVLSQFCPFSLPTSVIEIGGIELINGQRTGIVFQRYAFIGLVERTSSLTQLLTVMLKLAHV